MKIKRITHSGAMENQEEGGGGGGGGANARPLLGVEGQCPPKPEISEIFRKLEPDFVLDTTIHVQRYG